ncbi:MAG TPA: DUF1684 domain-containing protein [Candidatus Marinimicrobia bacterium]|nr:DUF1684 domain-containing protein [Candidatus Neomarinimicrobiota bacterium]
MNELVWRERILEEREQKDEFFKLHPQSPLSFKDRQKFNRLQYYPPIFSYCYELPLYEHAQKSVLTIEDTQGNEREFLRWGEFRFSVDNIECVLQAYKSSPQEKRLFIPFRDATSGKETYGAGRYLDLEEDWHTSSRGEKWILDFIRAYNPWCAYSDQYACPFVDPENWLKLAIRAGEKNFSL